MRWIKGIERDRDSIIQNRPDNNLAWRLLALNLDTRAEKTVYFCEEETVSYRQLADAACRFKNLLQAKGVRPGDRIMIILPDSPVFVAAFLGTILAGAVAVPVSTALSNEDYQYIIEDSGARLLFTSAAVPIAGKCPLPDGIFRMICGESLHNWLTDSPSSPFSAEAVHETGIAFIQYTSGSTGHPKGVPHRHRDMLVSAEQYGVKVLGIREDDLLFSASKLFFGYGLGNSLGFTLYAGASAVLHPGKPIPETLLSLIDRHKPSIFFSVPTVYAQIIRSITADHLELSMRFCVSAGEALPPAIFNEWKRLTGIELLDGIGTTEMFHIFISNYPGTAEGGSSGHPVPGYEIRLVDDNGAPVPSGTAGHLQVRGLSSTPAYWNQSEKTAEMIMPDGFIKTGDVFVENKGRYSHHGRSDDMMRVGGQWIAPQQIEDVLRSHPDIADCAVAGYKYGGLERPAAYIILNQKHATDHALERELRSFLTSHLPDYMLPVRYFLVEELPRTATGKVQRFKLKQNQKEISTMTDVENIKEIMLSIGFKKELVDGIDPSQPLASQGMDSVDFMLFAIKLEKTFGKHISDSDSLRLKTLNDFIEVINA